MSEQQNQLMRLLPFVIPAAAFLIIFGREDHVTVAEIRDVHKESEFLAYNKDQIFTNMLQAEEHLHNLADKKIDVSKGEASCVVKHLALAEGNADEGISHSADVTNAGIMAQGTPEEFKIVRDGLHEVRYKFAEGNYSPKEAITKLRDVRRRFESFNPQFDISKCKACSVEASI